MVHIFSMNSKLPCELHFKYHNHHWHMTRHCRNSSHYLWLAELVDQQSIGHIIQPSCCYCGK